MQPITRPAAHEQENPFRPLAAVAGTITLAPNNTKHGVTGDAAIQDVIRPAGQEGPAGLKSTRPAGYGQHPPCA